MIPRIAVVGYKKSGKTTLVKTISRILQEQGYKVLPIKHIPHKEFTIEKDPNKDTAQLLNTINITAYIAESGETGLLLRCESIEKSIDTIYRIAAALEANVLIFEGFRELFLKDEYTLKIICIKTIEEIKDFDNIEGPYIFCTLSNINDSRIVRLPDDLNILRRLVLSYIDVMNILRKLPKINCGKCRAGSCLKMAELIYRGMATLQECKVLSQRKGVKLVVNDAEIPLNEFVQKLLKNVVKAFIQSLKGVPEKLESVHVYVDFS